MQKLKSATIQVLNIRLTFRIQPDVNNYSGFKKEVIRREKRNFSSMLL